MHFSETGVGAAVHRPAVDVVAKQVGVEDEEADVGRGAEVDKLLDLMLEESFVDQPHEHQLSKRWRNTSCMIQYIVQVFITVLTD